MTTNLFTQTRSLMRQLTLQEKLLLLNDLTTQLVQQTVKTRLSSELTSLPTIKIDHWPEDLPLRREELYDEHGR